MNMIRSLLQLIVLLLIIALLGATILPKKVLDRVIGRVSDEWESMTLPQFKENVVYTQIRNRTYAAQYANLAKEVRDSFGIPVSITLAQGILESAGGTSRIAKESNNHFGLKCHSKCVGCTCRNYASDTYYDMFRVFESVRDCYFARAERFVTLPRYSKLFKYTDYVSWAYGLKRAGYAEDPQYAEKLIYLIERMNLNKYDN